jgi:uncharacterized protein YkwD
MKLRLLPILLVATGISSGIFAQKIDVQEYRREALKLINQERARQHLDPLTESKTVDVISQEWAQHLAKEEELVHRSRSNLIEYLKKNDWETMTENLFQADVQNSPKECIKAWMESPHHRDNLLDKKCRKAGLGIVVGKDKKTYVVFNGIKEAPPLPPGVERHYN